MRLTSSPSRSAPLTRAKLCARIATLRVVLDLLWEITDLTGGPPFQTISRAKIELIELERRVYDLDRAADRGEPLPLEVALALVGQTAAEAES